MYIQFNEKDHIYSLNGEIASISITELLHKHGLAPNYEGIPKAVLKASAKTGKEYHKEFEEITRDVEVAPKTDYGIYTKNGYSIMWTLLSLKKW